MKAVITLLLIVIASGVGYLAYSEYQKQQLAKDIAERIRDPEGYIAKEWAERAKLQCDQYLDVELVDKKGGFKRPVSFSCISVRTGNWKIIDRECTKEEMDYSPGKYDTRGDVSKGYPKRAGELYKPSYVVCWEVKSG